MAARKDTPWLTGGETSAVVRLRSGENCVVHYGPRYTYVSVHISVQADVVEAPRRHGDSPPRLVLDPWRTLGDLYH